MMTVKERLHSNQLKEFMEEELAKGNYVIAGGDFNQVFSTVDISDYPSQEGMWTPGRIEVAEFSDDWTFLMDNQNPSCRFLDKPYEGADQASFQYYVIDGFIVSGNIEVDEFYVLDEGFQYADHNPVFMRFSLK